MEGGLIRVVPFDYGRSFGAEAVVKGVRYHARRNTPCEAIAAVKELTRDG